MAKIDRLGWVAGLVIEAHGTRVGIRVNKEALNERLRQEVVMPDWQLSDDPEVDQLISLRAGKKPTRRGQRNYHLLYIGAQRVDRTLELDELFNSLRANLDAIIGLTSPTRVFVEAGVVAWEDLGLLVVGDEGSGRSRLVQALVDAGARFYSNHYAVVDESGRVRPYARPLKLDEQNLEPEKLGWTEALPEVPVGLVVSTRYKEKVNFRPRRLTPGRAALELASRTLSLHQHPRQGLEVLARLARTAQVLKGSRGEAEIAAQRLLGRLKRLKPTFSVQSA